MGIIMRRSPKRATRGGALICGLLVVAMTRPGRTAAFSPSTLGHATKYSSRGHGYNFALSASTSIQHYTRGSSTSNLAVALDRPLLSPIEFAHRTPASKSVWSSFLAVLLSDVCKTALIAFLLAVGVSLLPKLFSKVAVNGGGAGVTASNIVERVEGGASNIAERASDKLSAMANRIISLIQSVASPTKADPKRKKRSSHSTPMPFDGDGGWGKCVLRSKKSIIPQGEEKKFTVYEFGLPQSHYTVPLALGQQLSFCCLSKDDDICTGNFYPFSVNEGKTGVVRVVLPNDKEAEEGSSKFTEVLRDELRTGDEVAIKPGKHHLAYHGKHVPVTDTVYLASGLGIVPVLDQIKATLPRGSSSVKTSSVVWINDDRETFDLAMDELEAEYMKYPSKLAVSCIMDDVSKNPIEGNAEVEEAVPYFNAGTMAVVAGPKRFAERARGYLARKGYPENCVCVLP